jgi:hypothetical protein
MSAVSNRKSHVCFSLLNLSVLVSELTSTGIDNDLASTTRTLLVNISCVY